MGYISSTAYADACFAATPSNLIELTPRAARPSGTYFLGARNLMFDAHPFDSRNSKMRIILDSGSDITLISADQYKLLPDRPPKKEGRTIEIKQVSGELQIHQYVQLTLIIPTAEGPVQLSGLEAYIVPGMNRPFILGNDFADQYSLYPTRTEQGTFLVLGSSGRTIPLHNSTYSTETMAVTVLHTRAEDIKPSREIKVAYDVTIPPHTGKLVPVRVHWPPGMEELYVESIDTFDPSGENSYVMEAIISKGTEKIVVINRGSLPLDIPAGQTIGYTRNPRTYLQKKFKDPKMEAQALAIQSIM